MSYVTPAGYASAWGIMTNEQPQVHRALSSAGVRCTHSRASPTSATARPTLEAMFTNTETRLPCGALVIVGARFANDELFQALSTRADDLKAAGIQSVTRIGDALAPGALVHAVYSGHRYARELDADPASLAYRRDAPLPGAWNAPAAASLAPPQRFRVRWIIFLFQFAFGFVVYVQQRSLTVAGERMMPELGLSQMQLGWLEEALLIGYTMMQFPGA